MIQDARPVQIHCVEQAAQTNTVISVSGSNGRIEKLLSVLPSYRDWKLEGQSSTGPSQRLIVLRGPGELPYREIGGLIFEAQHLKLALVVTSGAPLCQDEEKEK